MHMQHNIQSSVLTIPFEVSPNQKEIHPDSGYLTAIEHRAGGRAATTWAKSKSRWAGNGKLNHAQQTTACSNFSLFLVIPYNAFMFLDTL